MPEEEREEERWSQVLEYESADHPRRGLGEVSAMTPPHNNPQGTADSEQPARQSQDDGTCKTCKHPTCMQRTTTSNAYKVCTVRVTHTSATAPTSAPCPQHQIWQHCPVAAQVAKAAREQVLGQLLYDIDGETGFYVFPHQKATAGNGLSRFILLDDLAALVESLRSQQEAEQPKEERR